MGLLNKMRAAFSGAVRGATEQKRKRVLAEYVEAASKFAGRTMVDERELPYPKETIRQAMLSHMKDKPEFRSISAQLYIGTAIYQRDVTGRDALELLESIERDMRALEAELRTRGYQ